MNLDSLGTQSHGFIECSSTKRTKKFDQVGILRLVTTNLVLSSACLVVPRRRGSLPKLLNTMLIFVNAIQKEFRPVSERERSFDEDEHRGLMTGMPETPLASVNDRNNVSWQGRTSSFTSSLNHFIVPNSCRSLGIRGSPRIIDDQRWSISRWTVFRIWWSFRRGRRQKTLNDSDPSHTKGSFYNLYHCYNGAIHSYSNSYMWFSEARQSPNQVSGVHLEIKFSCFGKPSGDRLDGVGWIGKLKWSRS